MKNSMKFLVCMCMPMSVVNGIKYGHLITIKMALESKKANTFNSPVAASESPQSSVSSQSTPQLSSVKRE